MGFRVGVLGFRASGWRDQLGLAWGLQATDACAACKRVVAKRLDRPEQARH